MQVVPTKSGGLLQRAFEISDSLAEAGNGKSIVIPDIMNVISVQVEPSGGCFVKVQTTLDRVNNVYDDSAIWVDWDYGLVSVNTQKKCVPVTAIRLVQDGSGSSIIKVRAQ